MTRQRDLADSALKINYLDNITSDVQEQITEAADAAAEAADAAAAAALTGGGDASAYALHDLEAPVYFKKVDIS